MTAERCGDVARDSRETAAWGGWGSECIADERVAVEEEGGVQRGLWSGDGTGP